MNDNDDNDNQRKDNIDGNDVIVKNMDNCNTIKMLILRMMKKNARLIAIAFTRKLFNCL